MRTIILRLVLIPAIFTLSVDYGNTAPYQQKPATRQQQPTSSEKAKQSKRWAFVQELIKEGVFIKVEKAGTLPHVHVGRPFYRLTFDDKSQFINVVWAYYKTENPKADLIIIKDGYSGKQVGKYSEAYGGLKMD